MINVVKSITNKVKKYGLERFLNEVICLDKESVIEEESINGLPTITVIHPNKSKTSFCLHQYCFTDSKNYPVMIDSCFNDGIEESIKRQLNTLAFRRNSTPILVTQVMLLSFDIDTAETFTDCTLNIEKTEYKYTRGESNDGKKPRENSTVSEGAQRLQKQQK